MTAVIPGAKLPTFRRRWRGYDRTEVDQFLSEVIADRQRLQESLAQVDTLIANSHQDRASTTTAEAKRLAEEIRTQAEQRARRLVQEAADQAEVLYHELLQGSQRDLERVTMLRREVANCLQVSVGALTPAHERASSETEAGVEASPAGPAIETPATAVGETEPGRPAWPHRRRATATLVCIFVSGLLGTFLTHQSGARQGPPAEADQPRALEAFALPPAPEPTVPRQMSRPGAEETSAAAVVSAPETDGLLLTLTARRLCWITTLVDGEGRLERLMPPDETIVLHAQEEAFLRVGDAAALSMLINNQPAKPLGTDGQVVNLRITRTNYPSYLIEAPTGSSTAGG